MSKGDVNDYLPKNDEPGGWDDNWDRGPDPEVGPEEPTALEKKAEQRKERLVKQVGKKKARWM